MFSILDKIKSAFSEPMFKPTPKKEFVPVWYVMPINRYQEYDKDHLHKCGSVIVKSAYSISENRCMRIYFNGKIRISSENAKWVASAEGLEPVNDIDVHARLTRKYEKHIEKEQMDYRNIILAGDVVDADI